MHHTRAARQQVLASAATSGINAEVLSGKRLLTAVAGVAKEKKQREHKEALDKCFTNPLVNKDAGKGIIDILRDSNPNKVQEKKQIANRSFAVADVPLLLQLLFGKPTAKDMTEQNLFQLGRYLGLFPITFGDRNREKTLRALRALLVDLGLDKTTKQIPEAALEEARHAFNLRKEHLQQDASADTTISGGPPSQTAAVTSLAASTGAPPPSMFQVPARANTSTTLPPSAAQLFPETVAVQQQHANLSSVAAQTTEPTMPPVVTASPPRGPICIQPPPVLQPPPSTVHATAPSTTTLQTNRPPTTALLPAPATVHLPTTLVAAPSTVHPPTTAAPPPPTTAPPPPPTANPHITVPPPPTAQHSTTAQPPPVQLASTAPLPPPTMMPQPSWALVYVDGSVILKGEVFSYDPEQCLHGRRLGMDSVVLANWKVVNHALASRTQAWPGNVTGFGGVMPGSTVADLEDNPSAWRLVVPKAACFTVSEDEYISAGGPVSTEHLLAHGDAGAGHLLAAMSILTGRAVASGSENGMTATGDAAGRRIRHVLSDISNEPVVTARDPTYGNENELTSELAQLKKENASLRQEFERCKRAAAEACSQLFTVGTQMARLAQKIRADVFGSHLSSGAIGEGEGVLPQVCGHEIWAYRTEGGNVDGERMQAWQFLKVDVNDDGSIAGKQLLLYPEDAVVAAGKACMASDTLIASSVEKVKNKIKKVKHETVHEAWGCLVEELNAQYGGKLFPAPSRKGRNLVPYTSFLAIVACLTHRDIAEFRTQFNWMKVEQTELLDADKWEIPSFQAQGFKRFKSAAVANARAAIADALQDVDDELMPPHE